MNSLEFSLVCGYQNGMSSTTEEIIHICETLPADKQAELAEVAAAGGNRRGRDLRRICRGAKKIMTRFSRSLSLQATRDGVFSSAIAEDVIRPACLSSGR